MEIDSDAFEVIAEKLAKLLKFSAALVAFALCFAAVDLISGKQAAKELEREALEVRKFALASEEVAARLRFMLSDAYPDRSLDERQRLTFLVNDIRRVRGLLESQSGLYAALTKYTASVSDTLQGSQLRDSIQRELVRLRQLVYFNGPQPDGDVLGANFFVDVGINDLSSESAINQQPVVHVAVLLIGALSLPGEFAATLDNFVKKSNQLTKGELIELEKALAAMNERGRILDAAFANTGEMSFTLAQRLLDEYANRIGFATGEESDGNEIRASKYPAPSIDALNQLLTDVRLAYYSEMSKARGVRAIDLPGTSIQLPGHILLSVLPLVLVVLIYAKMNLALQGRTVGSPKSLSRLAAEIKYGHSVLRLMEVESSQTRVCKVAYRIFVAAAPFAVAVPLFFTWGWSTLPFSLFCALLVWGMEWYLAGLRFSPNTELRKWPAKAKP